MMKLTSSVIVNLLLISSVMAGSLQDFSRPLPRNTGYINGHKIKIQHSRWFVGAGLNATLYDVDVPDTAFQPGIIGYEIESGYLWNVYAGNYLGVAAGWHQNSPSVFTLDSGGQVSTSTQIAELKAIYKYMFYNGFGIGINGGYSYAFGWNDTSGGAEANSFYSRWMPMTGIQITQQIDTHISAYLGYEFYFGLTPKGAFLSSNNAPRQQQFRLGVRYEL